MRSPLRALLFHCLSGCLLFVALNTVWASKSSTATQVYDIPRVDGITIDGHGEDWGARGFVVHLLVDSEGARRLSPEDFNSIVRLGWNDEGLLVLVDVRDDQATESDNDQALYRGDAIELFMANTRGGTDSYQLVCSPGMDPKYPVLRTDLADRRNTASLKAIPISVRAVSCRKPGGYQIEALLPWSAFQITPSIGREVGFQIYVDDKDSGPHKRCVWFPSGSTHLDNSLMYSLRLSARGSAPVLASAVASLERLRRICVDVAATSELAGKTAKLRNGKTVLGVEHIERSDDGNAYATFVIPLAAAGKQYDALHVDIDGQSPVPLISPDADALRATALQNAEFRFNPFVFTDATLPGCDFVDAPLVEDLIGRYTVSTSYYNSAHQPVKSADTPGRYGAVVTIASEHGVTIKKYCTLYRQPESIDWGALTLSSGLELPKGLGIDPAVAEEQAATVADFSKWILADRLAQDEAGAIVLAALAETAPKSGKATWRTDPWARNERWWAAQKKQLGELQPYKYVTYLPDGYAADMKKQWPLLIMLHGSGDRFLSDEAFATFCDRFKMVEYAKKDYPCVLIAPHCPPDETWSPYRLNVMLDQLMQTYRVDPDRVYLTGLSMGGFGTFSWAMESPERFAAIAPICGGADPGDAPRLQSLPIWVFHGTKDESVPFSFSEKMVDALRALKADVQFRIYENCTHDVWTATFNDPQLYQWFFAHTRKK